MADNELRVRDVLARDVNQRIEPVVKVYDRAHLAEDLRQFVITDSLARELRKFLDDFTENLRSRLHGGSGGDGMAVWLWGFFGSGKSHVAKVLGHLLEDDVIEEEGHKRAMDLFNLLLDDPSLPGAADLRAALAEIRTHAWCRTIPFEIKSKTDMVNPESVTEICLRTFYESLDLAPTVWLARLERKLQAEGHYEAFLRLYREQNAREWSADRHEHSFYLDQLAAALAATLDRPLESAQQMIAGYQRDHARVSPEGAVGEFLRYLDGMAPMVKPRRPHLIFVIDEMGQFIGDSGDRIHELQAIIEQAGSQGRGRIWLICTSQEALDQVVNRTGLKLSALGKLEARFCTRIALTGEDVRRVVEDRLLRKKETARPQLAALYKRQEGAIEELSRLNLERRLASLDQDTFAASYPFLPYAIPLVQEMFNAMRGFKLSGSERSMIGLAQGSLQALADRPLGALASIDLIFEQVTDELSSADYLGTTGVKLIRDADRQIDGTPLPPSRVLKALWLASRLPWVPRTPEVLSKLLAQRLDTDLPALHRAVEATLERLQRAGLVGYDQATGQYRYLSEKERGIEEDIVRHLQEMGSGIGVAKRRAAELLKTRVLTRARLGDYRAPFGQAAKADIPFSVYLDEETITSGGEIAIRFFSALASPKLDEIERANLGQGSKGRDIWWVSAEDETLLDKLRRLEALEKVPQMPKWRNDRSDDTAAVLKQKAIERDALETHLTSLLEAALKKGEVYYSGQSRALTNGGELKATAAELVIAVADHLYTRFSPADRAFDERNIPAYLRPATKDLARLDPRLELFDAQGHLIRSAPLAEAVFDELERRRDEGDDLHGGSLGEHFARIPFGWPDALLRLVLAAMLRGGALYLERPDSDQPVYDVATPGVETLFTSPRRFREVRFIPTAGGLTPPEVREVREVLIALGETALPDAAQGLAERIRSLGARLANQAGAVAQRVADLRLPLPDTYTRSRKVVEPASTLRDPVACVRRFLADREAWQEQGAFLQAYDEFQRNQRDAAFRDYAAVLAFAEACATVYEGPQGAEARDAAAEFQAIVRAREIMPRWKPLQEAALVVVDRYRQVYRSAYQACRQGIDSLRAEVEAAPAYTRLEPARRERVLAAHFGPRSALALPVLPALDSVAELRRASERRRANELETLRLALGAYRSAIYQQCEQEWQAQQAAGGEGPAPEPPPAPVYRLSVRGRMVGRRFTTADEFEAFCRALRDEVTARLTEGFQVELEE